MRHGISDTRQRHCGLLQPVTLLYWPHYMDSQPTAVKQQAKILNAFTNACCLVKVPFASQCLY